MERQLQHGLFVWIMEVNTYIVVVSWEQITTTVKQVVANFGDYILLFDNAILVNTEYRSSEIRDALKRALADDAQIYVCGGF